MEYQNYAINGNKSNFFPPSCELPVLSYSINLCSGPFIIFISGFYSGCILDANFDIILPH